MQDTRYIYLCNKCKVDDLINKSIYICNKYKLDEIPEEALRDKYQKTLSTFNVEQKDIIDSLTLITIHRYIPVFFHKNILHKTLSKIEIKVILN